MATFRKTAELEGAEIVDSSMRGARIVGSDLSGLVGRGVYADGVDLDLPWLSDSDAPFLVNGVDVRPYVAAELDRRFPGRVSMRAEHPDDLRAAFAALETAWTEALERVATMPPGTVDVSVAGEWSFAQTVRHLVFATDAWLGRAVLRLEQPFHPLGLFGDGTDEGSIDVSLFATGTPPYDDVLAARADRVALVGAYLATATAEQLDAPAANPWEPHYQETSRSCVHTILEEGWEHLRFALRDLDAIEAGETGVTSG